MDRILLIDDDMELCQLVREYLEPEGFSVEVVHHGETGAALALAEGFSLVVLDVMLPGLNGFDVLRKIRLASSVPVLMLTARGDDVDRIVGLEIGADDYLSKPFNPRELLARMRAILRRAGSAESRPNDPVTVLQAADIELDGSTRTVRRNGVPLQLTTVEFDLLARLLRGVGKVVTREALSEEVLERRFNPLDRSIDMHVSNLRRKLGPNPDGTERIKSIRGAGYIFIASPLH